MTRVVASEADAGRPCPYCRFPLKQGVAAERCDSCMSLHHEDCWQDGGGCAVLGCIQSGQGATGPVTSPQAGWPAPSPQPGLPVSPPSQPVGAYSNYGYPGGYSGAPPAPMPPQRSGSQAVLLGAVIIALLGIGTGVVVATGVLSNGVHTVAPRSTVAAAASAKSSAPTIPIGPSQSEQVSDRDAIIALLNAYQSAYSEHDIPGLSNIFASAIDRHGLAAGGCTVSRGRSAVLADYRSQFEQGSGSYELVGLSDNAIRFDGKTRARLDAHYQIASGGAGYVNFKFADVGEGWKISEVYATCN